MSRATKYLLTILLAVPLISGCASHIAYGPNGMTEASNYTITETLGPDGKVAARSYTPFVPDRWYSDALDKMAPLINQVMAMYQTLNPVKPAPAPAPAPAPIPTPTPSPNPTPTPTPAPIVPPIASKVFSRNGNVITLDMNTLPGSMRTAGFSGRDNALFYAMTNVYRNPDLPLSVKPGDDELAKLNTQRRELYDWFDNEVEKVRAVMTAEPSTSLIAITNDAYDRLGCRLGPAIVNKLKQFGSRVTLGEVLPEP